MADLIHSDRRRFALSMTVFAALCAGPCATASFAQSFPSRPITMVVPVSAGSAQDFIARLLGPMLSQKFGQPVIVDNKVGASGTIGAAAVARSAPDGHTLFLGATIFSMAPALQKSLPYDPLTDFAPIAPLCLAPMGLVVHASVPANTLQELVSLAKAKPGALNYGSPGNGSPHHMLMELFKQQAGVNLLHVPYKALGGMVNDVTAGNIQAAFMTVFQIMPQAQAGRLKLLAVDGAQRASAAPNVPTFTQAGIAGLEGQSWLGMLAPGKTPPEIVRRWNQEINILLALPEVQEGISKLGLVIQPGTPEDLAARIRRDLELWPKVVERGGIKAD